MMLVNILGWSAAVLGLTGALLNAHKKISGFYMWLVADILQIVVALLMHTYFNFVLFVAYAIMTVYGLVVWSTRSTKA